MKQESRVAEILEKHVLNEGQLKLLSLLKKFDGLCQKHNITYYLGGGTALGAIRHLGFLPWDDDIDLYIPRKEYKKLVEIQDEFFDDEFIMVNNENFDLYRNTLVRLVDVNSTAITKARIVDDAPKGQFVELFILDPLPEAGPERDAWFTKQWIYAELLSTTFKVANQRIARNVDMALYDEYEKRCETEGRAAVLHELEQEIFNIDESEATEYCGRWGLRNLIYNIEWFGEPRYVPFEDTVMPVPHNAERVLRFDYGDSWMYIPVVDQQIVHSITSDMNIPYKTYVDSYKNSIDFKAVWESYTPRKRAMLDVYSADAALVAHSRLLKQEAVKLSMMRRTADIDLEKLLAEKCYGELREIFEPFYTGQREERFWAWTSYLDIGDNLLYYALVPLLVSSEYSTVIKIIRWRKQLSEAVSAEVESLFEYANFVRDAYSYVDEENFDEVNALLNKCSEYPLADDQYDYMYLSLLAKKNACDNPASLKDEAEMLLQKYPEKGELCVILADALMADGQTDEAVDAYIRAYDTTRHGFIHRHIISVLNSIMENK